MYRIFKTFGPIHVLVLHTVQDAELVAHTAWDKSSGKYLRYTSNQNPAKTRLRLLGLVIHIPFIVHILLIQVFPVAPCLRFGACHGLLLGA
jgi:hypothetical protein